MNESVLVAGASGRLGVCLTRALVAQGYRVRALGRDGAKLAALGAAETVVADITQPANLAGVYVGVDYVISCAGASLNMRALFNRTSFDEIDWRGNLNLLAAAQRAGGIKKFVYVSLACADKLQHTEYAATHESVVNALAQADLNYAVIRPTGFFGFLLDILNFARANIGLIIGDGARRTDPIHEADVARACLEALTSDEKESVIGGAEIFTRREITELAFAALGKSPRLMHVSPKTFRRRTAPTKLFNRRLYELMQFGLEVTQIDCLAPVYGTRRLAEFFTAHVRSQTSREARPAEQEKSGE